MALTQGQLARAYAMAEQGETSKAIARRVRISPASAAAVKANFTRSQASHTSTTTSSGPLVIRVNNERLRNAIANGLSIADASVVSGNNVRLVLGN